MEPDALELNFLSNDGGPHAVIEAQRPQQDEPESNEDQGTVMVSNLNTLIIESDPYCEKSYERCMVFVSDSVPVDLQYKALDQSFSKKNTEVEFFSAVDKAYEWSCTGRGVTGATVETFKDGRISRHFVLKIGPPNSPNGDALRVAKRLKALVEHFFFTTSPI
ncbi:uncharacterized protein M421DRAFT_8866 [Didymella exigua CBS 183.55]|uniref:Uncharacterized protein n=1 Tax=Didymella exigua CBS 183.55 TaxID=1150837 RepID=A0A6A5RB07_9PLEO|nr:uncharacterized protein M421DRAFT_8866 [Didymella exigua CBS 183.55]KAF1924388.1 hypothetical protein M421DRAFT_8866 [Didymella exigua CBS 183.55]